MKSKSIRLISLNTWSGRALYSLTRFFRKRAGDTDIFCLQEVCNSPQAVVDQRHPDEHVHGPLFDKISAELKGFEGSFAYFDDDPNRMSLAMFARQDVPLKTIEDFIVYRPAQPKETGSAVFSARKLQYITLDLNGREVLIANYHGLWNNGPKTDTPERIDQSKRIKQFLDGFDGPKILCGDFNLLPETESLQILEKGMRNLVKDYKIQSTRTPLYRHYENPSEPNFADYILVSPDVKVKRFEVLSDMVSDHAALFLEFNY